MNLVLITIDTLRARLGFMGYGKPTTPNLDALAARARSSTARTRWRRTRARAWAHAHRQVPERDDCATARTSTRTAPPTRSSPSASRKRAIHTMGAASHWYFVPWYGLTQGMDVWDMSAVPARGRATRTRRSTSEELSDAALRLLGEHENTRRPLLHVAALLRPARAVHAARGRAPDFRGGDSPGRRPPTTARCGSPTSTSGACSTSSRASRGARARPSSSRRPRRGLRRPQHELRTAASSGSASCACLSSSTCPGSRRTRADEAQPHGPRADGARHHGRAPAPRRRAVGQEPRWRDLAPAAGSSLRRARRVHRHAGRARTRSSQHARSSTGRRPA